MSEFRNGDVLIPKSIDNTGLRIVFIGDVPGSLNKFCGLEESSGEVAIFEVGEWAPAPTKRWIIVYPATRSKYYTIPVNIATGAFLIKEHAEQNCEEGGVIVEIEV